MRGPAALVTGGNRGLGLETCRQLVARGMRVFVGSRDLERGREAAGSLGGRDAVDVIALDVLDEESVAAAAARVRDEVGGLDVLVNNAGIALRGFDDLVARRTIDVNLHGVERVTNAFLPLMRPGARLVMVSSGSGELSIFSPSLRRRFENPALDRATLNALVEEFVNAVADGTHERRGWPSTAYGVSKAALGTLTRILAREHPELRINAVCPGWVRTDMGGSAAPRSVTEGAASIVWGTAPDVPTGGFFRDGRPIPW